MKKLLLGTLLLMSATAFGTGYVSTEYQAENNRGETSNEYQRLESYVGLDITEQLSLEVRHREFYTDTESDDNKESSTRTRLTYDINETFGLRYQLEMEGTDKSENYMFVKYRPFWNSIEGMSHTMYIGGLKTEHEKMTLALDSDLTYTIQQEWIPSLKIVNEIDGGDMINGEGEFGINTFIEATPFVYEVNGFKFYVKGRAYQDFDVHRTPVENKNGYTPNRFEPTTRFRAYVGMEKDFTVMEIPLETRVEYMREEIMNEAEDNTGSTDYIQARLRYKF